MEKIFDDVMRGRVIALQQAKGLKPDGLAGPRTWFALATKESPQEPALDLNAIPLLVDLAKSGGDEQGVRDFFTRVCGVDLAAILRDLDEALDGQPEVTP